ncbi:tetratricopeptide repeat family protein [Tamlana nanhaiensis]|uniref:Tetratricopeptide repeat family protein n=1 Tax=Neotamlana nanhaiensis TaxID=1382798 RepID=A0A0D7VZ87_9FLAO|nr:thioredoxin family protein [Tamlana nanhaiensis]KJD31738.1 tetratricopeptide repeat family protein [Tamlana nanhaiensis]
MKRTVTFIFLICLQLNFSQDLNQLIITEKGKEVLLGEINKTGLTQNSFGTWFNKNYNDYVANKSLIKKLKDSLNTYQIKVFLGTWCGDSKREVPRFYKVLEAAKFPENNLQVFALNNTEDAYKQSPNHEEKGLNIHRVPTFIFYKNGKEVNRIVELPVETFERDIYNITLENKYRSNYFVANFMDQILQTKSIDSLKLEAPVLIPRIAEFVKGSRELNTYGYSLLRSNQTEKALFIFELNTKIFPYKYNVFDSLGEAYFKTENYTEALKNYYKVLSLVPDDENALKMINKINLKQN